MEEKVFTLRKVRPPEVFRTIRLIGNEPYRFVGNFKYLRIFYKGYNVETGDLLDRQILRCIQSIFDASQSQSSQLLLFDQQLEHCLILTKGQEINILMYLVPLFDFESNKQGNTSISPIIIKTSIVHDGGDTKLISIPKELLVQLPIEDLEKLRDTIKPI